ncbi:barstar family protein [Streptomyces naganishii]|uniref:barstar family protein n=1 Tax=Streptomyces naganishii TaxID=285447 RepID=UPI0036A212CD
MTELVVTLDLEGVTDKAGLMDRVARALALPPWFGRNWDALADSLSDVSAWPEEAAGGLLFVVRNWRAYAEARPQEWETAQEVFAHAMRSMPSLTVALTLGGSS